LPALLRQFAYSDLQRMIDKRPNQEAEEPHSEPEIIPPGGAERGRPRIRFYVDERIGRVYIAKPGPLGTILTVLIVGLLLTVMLIMLLGAFLVFLPVVALFVTAAIVAGLLRVYFQR
jgi:hypothetical protein